VFEIDGRQRLHQQSGAAAGRRLYKDIASGLYRRPKILVWFS